MIHAFEPIPLIRTRLISNLEQSAINNVIVYPFALSREFSQVQFHHIENLPEESGIKARHIYNMPPTTTHLIDLCTYRLDDLLPQVLPAFVKIDIEGGELDMLRGATAMLQRARPIVSFECGAASFLGYHDTPEDIFHIFRRADFSVYSIVGHHMIDAKMFREASHAQAFWDYVAFPAEKAHMAKFLNPA